jgi:hypothetical protein
MVLGIQGAFNEFELSMILDRMQESLRQKAQRGEQYDALPTGYICRQAPLCEKHPDRRVQRAVEKVLHDFDRFPSAQQLYLQLLEEGFQLPVVPHGQDWREVEWSTPSYSQILGMVRNPTYAGIYVRGRRKAFTVLDENQHKQTKYRRVPREQWDVFLEGHHEAYIDCSTWERNVAKIAAGANVRGAMTKGSVGRGVSLMAGLLRCHRCGQRLQTRYPSAGVRYVCYGGQKQRARGKTKCLDFLGAAPELQLAEEILEVVGPAGLVAAKRAAEQLAAKYDQQRQLLVDRVQATQEAERRAAREYKQTDVTYTAVRQTLGAEWEAALARVDEEQSRLTLFEDQQPVLPTPAQQQQLEHLAEDVRRVWEHPRATMTLKQQLVRVLIEEIVAEVDEDRDQVVLWIQWSGGHHTELRGPRRQRRGKLPRAEQRSVVATLCKVLDDARVAAALNREQIPTPGGQTWTRLRVQQYRRREGIAAFSTRTKELNGWLTQSETASCLEISPMSVHRLVQTGIIPAEQPHAGLPMVITRQSLTCEVVRRAVCALKSGHTRPLPEDPKQKKLF